MDYATARQQIQDGDLIAILGKRGLLAPLTRYFTRTPEPHTGIAIWLGEDLWMAELNGGHNHLIPLAQYSGADFDVYYPPVPNRSEVRQATLDTLRGLIPYSLAALVVVGLLNWLRIKIYVHARREMVCSGYCVLIYEQAGWPERSRIISPHELAIQLVKRLEVRATEKPAEAGFFLGDRP